MEIIEITRSKLRRELLRFYFMHPGGKYYLRELEKLLKFSIGNIRRELQKLKKMGLFSSQKTGNLVYYSINKKYPLYNEIKNIVLKTVGLGDIFRGKLKKLAGIDCAFIYGSFARGEEIGTSDIDLMVIGDVSQNQLFSAVHKIEDEIGRTVNPTTFSLREVKERIKKNNHFILNVLKDKKIMIIGGEDELQGLGKQGPDSSL